jgi:hypothetical protein
MATKTYHGCTCLKDWVKIDGKKFSGCAYGSAADSKCPMTTDKDIINSNDECGDISKFRRCPVEKGCGVYPSWKKKPSWKKQAKENGILKDTDYWDVCGAPDAGAFGHPRVPSMFYKLSTSANIKAIIGLIIFLALAAFIIPHALYIMGHPALVKVWIPNIDLMATVFSFKGGLLNSSFFRFLYSWAPDTSFGFWSHLIIDYFALLGLTLITAQMVYYRKGISRGMSYALVMLLFSYLIPNATIEAIMGKIYASIYTECKHDCWVRTQLSILGGFLAVVCFLLLERFLINNYLHKIDNISSFIVNKLWRSLGHKHIKKRKK